MNSDSHVVITFTRIFGLMNSEKTSFVKSIQQSIQQSINSCLALVRSSILILSSNYVEKAGRSLHVLVAVHARGQICGLDDEYIDHFQCETF